MTSTVRVNQKTTISKHSEKRTPPHMIDGQSLPGSRIAHDDYIHIKVLIPIYLKRHANTPWYSPFNLYTQNTKEFNPQKLSLMVVHWWTTQLKKLTAVSESLCELNILYPGYISLDGFYDYKPTRQLLNSWWYLEWGRGGAGGRSWKLAVTRQLTFMQLEH